MPFDLGATVRLTGECRDPDGTLATAATAVVTITLPNETTVTPPVTEDPDTAGRYRADYVTTTPGRHTVRWVWTGPAAAYTDVFDVQEEAPPAILSLRDAREHLNRVSTTDDDELRFWNNATTRAVEYFVGPVVTRSFTEEHQVRNALMVVLHRTPVLAVTAVTSLLTGGVVYAADSLHVDRDTGEVLRLDGGRLTGRLRFTYRAGRTVIPENIRGAARIILEHLWLTQRGNRGNRGGLAGGGQDLSEPIPGLGYAIPNRALQLLEPDRLPPGVA
ncbi:hypothetical protein KBY55_09585 [Streptomyces sp. b94]|uniref:hypothetical protein n=1 Tax=Streptomyces sp. b94 TaxID=1827634 RepID=UPI001B36D9D0|nr:hypothetical protein [Streptomyces sp. b94]MBQ1096335.1 hypothetical protein [Streptomyces sp. b94]